MLTNRRFKRWGELGYIFGVLARLASLEHVAFPHRLERKREWDRRPCLFLTFSNSKFTGGKMMIAPNADPTDGQIEYVRWSPISRLRLLWLVSPAFHGHAHQSSARVARSGCSGSNSICPGPINVVVDGEILRLHCRSLEILPGALDVIV